MSDNLKSFSQHLFKEIQRKRERPLCLKKIKSFTDDLIDCLFPQRGGARFKNEDEVYSQLLWLRTRLNSLLECLGLSERKSESISNQFFHYLPHLRYQLLEDAQFFIEGDPAARTVEEVIICYPGLYALAIYRMAHYLYELETPLLPRILTEYAHEKTGIDIHPGAHIGHPVFIDHGTGIVIGETAIVGDFVKIYQGVTLGALSVAKDLENIKRHPTIGDNCVLYSNATILGGETVIGEGSVIGGNVWLTEKVPPYSKIFNRPRIEKKLGPLKPKSSKTFAEQPSSE